MLEKQLKGEKDKVADLEKENLKLNLNQEKLIKNVQRLTEQIQMMQRQIQEMKDDIKGKEIVNRNLEDQLYYYQNELDEMTAIK